MELCSLNRYVFASRSDDKTIFVWEHRVARPVTSMSSGRTMCQSMSGTPEHIVCSFQSKSLDVYDLRGKTAKPLFCELTDE
jgi:hypothetical protein